MLNQEELVELQVMRRELQEKINATKICWVCGRSNLITMHHAIPQRVHGALLNLTIPVCENCNCAVHKEDDLLRILKKMFLR